MVLLPVSWCIAYQEHTQQRIGIEREVILCIQYSSCYVFGGVTVPNDLNAINELRQSIRISAEVKPLKLRLLLPEISISQKPEADLRVSIPEICSHLVYKHLALIL